MSEFQSCWQMDKFEQPILWLYYYYYYFLFFFYSSTKFREKKNKIQTEFVIY